MACVLQYLVAKFGRFAVSKTREVEIHGLMRSGLDDDEEEE